MFASTFKTAVEKLLQDLDFLNSTILTTPDKCHAVTATIYADTATIVCPVI
jgi:hypothetical protein